MAFVAMDGGTVQIVYDGDGNRVAKSVNGVTTRYLADDLNPTGYAQVVEELSGDVVQRQYAYGLERIHANWKPRRFQSTRPCGARRLGFAERQEPTSYRSKVPSGS